MAKSFKTLKNTMTPAARRAAEAKTEEMILALCLLQSFDRPGSYLRHNLLGVG